MEQTLDFELNEEQQSFADAVRRFAHDKLAGGALERAHSAHFPWEAAKLVAAQGLMGIAFDEADANKDGQVTLAEYQSYIKLRDAAVR